MDKNTYKLLIFDWDGTLMDSEKTIIHCMQQAIVQKGWEPRSNESIRHIIGLGLDRAIQNLYPQATQPMINELIITYRANYFSHNAPQSQLFSGVKTALDKLKEAGYALAIATGKSRKGLDKELASSQLSHYFPITRTADETFSKPNPIMLDEITTDFNLQASDALMIGDSEYDLQMASNFGMDSLAVRCGVHDDQRLLACKPITLLSDITELPNYLSGKTSDYPQTKTGSLLQSDRLSH